MTRYHNAIKKLADQYMGDRSEIWVYLDYLYHKQCRDWEVLIDAETATAFFKTLYEFSEDKYFDLNVESLTALYKETFGGDERNWGGIFMLDLQEFEKII